LGRGCGRTSSRKGWDKLSSFTSFEVGDGSKINLWHDQWCGETTLKVAFPVLYVLACEKDASIAANLEFWGVPTSGT
jgi:hypothetical protein